MLALQFSAAVPRSASFSASRVVQSPTKPALAPGLGTAVPLEHTGFTVTVTVPTTECVPSVRV